MFSNIQKIDNRILVWYAEIFMGRFLKTTGNDKFFLDLDLIVNKKRDPVCCFNLIRFQGYKLVLLHYRRQTWSWNQQPWKIPVQVLTPISGVVGNYLHPPPSSAYLHNSLRGTTPIVK